MKKIVLLYAIVLSISQVNSQTQFWGMTSSGGSFTKGCILKTDGFANNETVEYSFEYIHGGNPKYTNLIAFHGKFYGVTFGSGSNSNGVLFEYDANTGVYTKKIDFSGIANGSKPSGSLMQASDSMLYGMTSFGGTNSLGILFQYNPYTHVLTKKIDFAGTANGSNPYGSLMQASDGMIYGLTASGGANGKGVLFQYDPLTSGFSKKIDFSGTLNGANPFGSLIQAADGKLYGTTQNGSLSDLGTIFQYDPVTNILVKKIGFSGTTGNHPYGDLLEASDGMFYGLTNSGGTNNKGVIYQYDPVTSSYTTKFDFNGTVNGSNPYGSLIQATDGLLYGVTENGGTGNFGVLFQYDPGSNSYTKKFDFTGTATGSSPYGSLMQASNGQLYGMTNDGGSKNLGTLFQYNITTNVFTKKFDFLTTPNGSGPLGSLLKASNGKLYGLTQTGGEYDNGVLFEYDPASRVFIKKFDFGATNDGARPTGSLIQASDGKIYGLTVNGGVNNVGVIFQYDPVASIVTKKMDFVMATKGGYPQGSLMQASDGMLYGLTLNGGANGFGVLFQYNPVTNGFIKKFDFSGIAAGANPQGSLMQASDGKLYGMTSLSGANSFGTLFQFNPITNAFVKKVDFMSSTTGEAPKGDLVQAADGMLYGMTWLGGATASGVLFQYDPVTSTYTKKLDFGNATVTSAGPQGTLLKASNGKLYAMAGGGILGTIFEYDPATNNYVQKFNFTGTPNGAIPKYNNFIEIPVSINTATINTVFCSGDSVYVPFSISGAYNPGNIFSVELSDATGSFASPLTIGTITATSTSAVKAVFPAVAITTNGFRVRVVSSNPMIAGNDNGANITLHPLPTLTTNSGSICSGQSFTIIPGGATTYTYSGGTDIVSPLADVSYSIIGTDINGCVSSVPAVSNITVNALPVITVSSTSTLLCVGETATLTASGSTTYTWNTSENTSVIVVSPAANTVYSVSTIDANNCSNMALVTLSVSVCTNIKLTEYNDPEIAIFPNPTNGILNINFITAPQNTKLEVYNTVGALVMTEMLSGKNNTIHISDLSNGMYFMKVLEGNKVVAMKKVVKE